MLHIKDKIMASWTIQTRFYNSNNTYVGYAYFEKDIINSSIYINRIKFFKKYRNNWYWSFIVNILKNEFNYIKWKSAIDAVWFWDKMWCIFIDWKNFIIENN